MAVEKVSNSNFAVTSAQKFTDFKQPQNGYFIQADQFSGSVEDKIDKRKLALKIGIGLLLGGLTSFGLVKVVPKSAIKKFETFKQYLERKIEKETTNSKTAIFYRTALKGALSFGEKCQGVNNIISFKDIWFKRQVTDKVPVLKKGCSVISKWFNNISKFTVRASYNSATKAFGHLDDYLSEVERGILSKKPTEIVNINGERKTAKEWVALLASKRQRVNVDVNTHFTAAAFDERYPKMTEIMRDLENRVWDASFADKHNFVKKDTYFTFIAEKFLAIDKVNYAQNIRNLRANISYNTVDQAKALRDILHSNKKLINPKDALAEQMHRDINKQLSALWGMDRRSLQYSKLQDEILHNLRGFEELIISGQAKFKYDAKTLDVVKEHNRIMKEILYSSKKGTLDEMLEIYEKLLPPESYNKLKVQVGHSVKALDIGINNEAVEYFDKLRDLKLGSAPTDILSMIFGFGALGIGLASANDKDTQASIALKYGIPAIGGMLTSMVMTSMLVSGGKSLVGGFVSSLIMSKVGVEIDKQRKKFESKMALQAQQRELDKAFKGQKTNWQALQKPKT